MSYICLLLLFIGISLRVVFCHQLATSTSEFSTYFSKKFLRDSKGYIHLVYEKDRKIYYKKSYDNGNSFTEPFLVSEEGSDSSFPSIYIDKACNLHVIWIDRPIDNELFDRLNYRKYDKEWKDSITIATFTVFGFYEYAQTSFLLDKNNNIHVIWGISTKIPDVGYFSYLYYATGDGLSFNFHEISTITTINYSPRLLVDEDNTIYFIHGTLTTVGEQEKNVIVISTITQTGKINDILYLPIETDVKSPEFFIDAGLTNNHLHILYSADYNIKYYNVNLLNFATSTRTIGTSSISPYPVMLIDEDNKIYIAWEDKKDDLFILNLSCDFSPVSIAATSTNKIAYPNFGNYVSRSLMDIIYTEGKYTPFKIIYKNIALGPELLISEVSLEHQYIEIYNRTNAFIDLSNYKVGDAHKKGEEAMFKFPRGYFINPGMSVIIATSAASFFERFNYWPDFEITDSVLSCPDMQIDTDWLGESVLNLEINGDEVLLLDSKDNVVDVCVWGIGSLTTQYYFVFSSATCTYAALHRSPKLQDTDFCSLDFKGDTSSPEPGGTIDRVLILPRHLITTAGSRTSLINVYLTNNKELILTPWIPINISLSSGSDKAKFYDLDNLIINSITIYGTPNRGFYYYDERAGTWQVAAKAQEDPWKNWEKATCSIKVEPAELDYFKVKALHNYYRSYLTHSPITLQIGPYDRFANLAYNYLGSVTLSAEGTITPTEASIQNGTTSISVILYKSLNGGTNRIKVVEKNGTKTATCEIQTLFMHKDHKHLVEDNTGCAIDIPASIFNEHFYITIKKPQGIDLSVFSKRVDDSLRSFEIKNINDTITTTNIAGIEIKLKYNDKNLPPGVEEDDLKVYHLNKKTGLWEIGESDVYKDENIVIARLSKGYNEDWSIFILAKVVEVLYIKIKEGTKCVTYEPFEVKVECWDETHSEFHKDYKGTLTFISDEEGSITKSATIEDGEGTLTVCLYQSLNHGKGRIRIKDIKGMPMGICELPTATVYVNYTRPQKVINYDDKEKILTEVNLKEYTFPKHYYVSMFIPANLDILDRLHIPKTAQEIKIIDFDGNTLTQGQRSAEVSLYYKDHELIDKRGERVNEEDIACYRYDTRGWMRLERVKLDTINNFITVKTNKFSIFVLGRGPKQSLKKCYVFPNPYKVHKGHTKLFFAGLTENVSIYIYNLAGELEKKIENINLDTDRYIWSNPEKELASGVYIYHIKNQAGEEFFGKFAIIK